MDISKNDVKKIISVLLAAVLLASAVFWARKSFLAPDENAVPAAGREEYPRREKKLNGSEFLYHDIFNDPKFRALQDNSFIRPNDIKPGNKNPFKAKKR